MFSSPESSFYRIYGGLTSKTSSQISTVYPTLSRIYTAKYHTFWAWYVESHVLIVREIDFSRISEITKWSNLQAVWDWLNWPLTTFFRQDVEGEWEKKQLKRQEYRLSWCCWEGNDFECCSKLCEQLTRARTWRIIFHANSHVHMPLSHVNNILYLFLLFVVVCWVI